MTSFRRNIFIKNLETKEMCRKEEKTLYNEISGGKKYVKDTLSEIITAFLKTRLFRANANLLFFVHETNPRADTGPVCQTIRTTN